MDADALYEYGFIHQNSFSTYVIKILGNAQIAKFSSNPSIDIEGQANA